MAATKHLKKITPWDSEIGKLLGASLEGNRRAIEASALRLIRLCRSENPDLSEQLSKILSDQIFPESAASRLNRGLPAPLDSDSNLGLLRITAIDPCSSSPILSESTRLKIEQFLHERRNSKRLLEAGLTPPSRLLLLGPPGTGKTMIASWLAGQLGMQLATYDLATAISSFLGRTGMNLRKALDYAREFPTILLMDEFDSVAKRRGDSMEVGELSRIVNTLLKEMEDWPSHSIFIAASNHGALLDEAVFRRFDTVVHLTLPELEQRRDIFIRSMGRSGHKLPDVWADVIALLTSGWNAADIERLSSDVLRAHVLSESPIPRVIPRFIPHMIPENLDSHTRADLVVKIRKEVGKAIPLRMLSSWFGIAESTIHHHISKPQS